MRRFDSSLVAAAAAAFFFIFTRKCCVFSFATVSFLTVHSTDDVSPSCARSSAEAAALSSAASDFATCPALAASLSGNANAPLRYGASL